MFTSILSAIAAIPELLRAIRELLAWFKKVDDEKWFKQSDEAFKPLESGPTTGAQKDEAAKQIGDLIHKL